MQKPLRNTGVLSPIPCACVSSKELFHDDLLSLHKQVHEIVSRDGTESEEVSAITDLLKGNEALCEHLSWLMTPK